MADGFEFQLISRWLMVGIVPDRCGTPVFGVNVFFYAHTGVVMFLGFIILYVLE